MAWRLGTPGVEDGRKRKDGLQDYRAVPLRWVLKADRAKLLKAVAPLSTSDLALLIV